MVTSGNWWGRGVGGIRYYLLLFDIARPVNVSALPQSSHLPHPHQKVLYGKRKVDYDVIRPLIKIIRPVIIYPRDAAERTGRLCTRFLLFACLGARNPKEGYTPSNTLVYVVLDWNYTHLASIECTMGQLFPSNGDPTAASNDQRHTAAAARSGRNTTRNNYLTSKCRHYSILILRLGGKKTGKLLLPTKLIRPIFLARSTPTSPQSVPPRAPSRQV